MPLSSVLIYTFQILQLDILVNNAGRSQRARWEDIELGVDREMFDLSVFGVVALSRIAVRYFQRKNEGHIVVTSSLAGEKAVPFSGSYTGAKHAIHVSKCFPHS
jgi:dehydrogenase/reductase SDR family protein 7